MVLLHLHCPSGAPLRYAVCHTSCSSYGIRHGSSCVLHATSFISSFVPLHYTSFVAKPFASCWASQAMHIPSHRECTSLSQANPTILTGFHFATLRHSFTSVAFSPPAALFSCARRQPHLGCVHLAAANCSSRTSISQSIAKVHLHSSAAFVPCREIYCGGFLWRQHRWQPLGPASFTLA